MAESRILVWSLPQTGVFEVLRYFYNCGLALILRSNQMLISSLFTATWHFLMFSLNVRVEIQKDSAVIYVEMELRLLDWNTNILFYRIISRDWGFRGSRAYLHCHYWGFHGQRRLLTQIAVLSRGGSEPVWGKTWVSRSFQSTCDWRDQMSCFCYRRRQHVVWLSWRERW